VSPTKIVTHPRRAPAALDGNGSRPSIRSASLQSEAVNRERLLDSLTNLRSVVSVFAEELVSARREASRLRVENGSLLEEVRKLQRGLPSDELRGAVV
jgi:predicted nuclease with TOPRIM domain